MRKTKAAKLLSILGCAVAVVGICALVGCASTSSEPEPTESQEQDYDVDSDTIVIEFVDENDPLNKFAAYSSPVILSSQSNGQDGKEATSETEGNGVSAGATDDATTPINEATENSTTIAAEDEARDNLCYSPASLYLALAMLGEGASGEAQQQITETLQLEGTPINDYAASAIQGLESGYDNYQLEIANSLWVKNGFNPTAEYKDAIESSFDAEVKAVEFGTSEADGEMSSWVSDKTKGLLNPAFQTSAHEIASLINTIYFKDSWTEPFEKSDTAPDTFHAQSGDVQADFLNAYELSSEYIEGSNYTAASLAFSGGGQMTFFLPNKGVTPFELLDTEAKANALINPDLNKVGYASVNWKLPKFKIESSFKELRQNLEDLGVTDVFESGDPEAFAKMIDPAGEFFVSDVVQETYMSLDEDGVEAAAYTAMVMKMSALPEGEEAIDFVLDRPFAYMVKAPNGMVIFMGIVENPA